MEIARATRRNGVYYLVSLRPEPFALGLYCVLLSFLLANLLWINVLILCSSLETVSTTYLLDELIYIHFVFALATTFVWWQLHKDTSESVLTHVMFFVWHGSKLLAASLEICSFTRFFDKLMHHTPQEDVSKLTSKMAWGLAVVGAVECVGFYFAYKYLRGQKPKTKPFKTHHIFPNTTMVV